MHGYFDKIKKISKDNAKRGVSRRLKIWSMTLKISSQNPLKDVDSRVFARLFRGKKNNPVTLTFKLENQ